MIVTEDGEVLVSDAPKQQLKVETEAEFEYVAQRLHKNDAEIAELKVRMDNIKGMIYDAEKKRDRFAEYVAPMVFEYVAVQTKGKKKSIKTEWGTVGSRSVPEKVTIKKDKLLDFCRTWLPEELVDKTEKVLPEKWSYKIQEVAKDFTEVVPAGEKLSFSRGSI